MGIKNSDPLIFPLDLQLDRNMTFFTKLISALTIMPTVCLLLACSDNNDLALEEPQSKILSAYHGLDALPAGANIL